jgi:hypothetical protein
VRWLVGLVVLVVGFVGLAELLLTPSLEEVVEQQVEAAGLGQRDVTVDLSGFPVVVRVAASGEVERAVVTLDEVSAEGIAFSTVRADVRGTEIARSALVDGEVTFESVRRVELSGTIPAAEITRLLPAGVTDLVLTPGSATVVVAGEQRTADVSATAGVLRVVPEGAGPIEVALPSGELFPCPLSGEVGNGVVRVSCTLDGVPQWLLDEASTDLTP